MPSQYTEFEALVAQSRYFLWVDSEWIMKKKNGTLFPGSFSITVLRNEANTITGYLFIGSDIENYKRWEQELREAQEAIDTAQISKNRFLTSLNHELKAPLNSISNFANLLLKNIGGNLKDLELTYAARIKENCHSMLNLINEILDMSKHEEKLHLSGWTAVRLDAFMKQIIDELGEFPQVQFFLEIPKETEPLKTDREKFNTLMQHLIRHVTHDFQGQLTLRVKTDPLTHQPIEIEMIQNELKSPRVEISESLTPQEESLDFEMAKSLANQLGYQITITKGSVYHLILKSDIGEASQENPSTNQMASNLDLGMENFNMTVLIMDDDPDFRTILTTYLQDLGCHVVSATSGAEVVHLAKSLPIDLITMDMLMSPMNGYDIVQQLQSDPNLKNIPFAFISVIAKDIRNKIPGALAFIDKPITRDDLIHLLQMCLAQRKVL
jgi:CheY-like chemotaxis protein